MGIDLTPGSRDFMPQDAVQAQPVAIVDESLARQFLPDGAAVGKPLKIFGDTNTTVVGVAKHVRLWNIRDEEGRGQVYRPHAQATYRGMTVAIRATGDAAPVETAARAALRAIDPAQPLTQVRPMSAVVAQSLGEQRLLMVLVLGFAATALVLAMLGIYGVTASAVTQRTRELGIRMALGAQRGSVIAAVLRQPMVLVLAGIGTGLAATLALAHVLQRFLYGVSSTDERVLAGVVVLTALVAFAAGYLPARVATRVDPASVLRAD